MSENLAQTINTTYDEQRPLTQAALSDNNRQIRAVLAKLENVENQITTASPQTPVRLLPAELVGAVLVLFCFCWHRCAPSSIAPQLVLTVNRHDGIRSFSENLLNDA